MKILWEHEDGMTIQEIVQYQEQNQLSTASTAQIVKHLLKKEAVRVNGFVPAANVYARKFVPCFSREEFAAAESSSVSLTTANCRHLALQRHFLAICERRS